MNHRFFYSLNFGPIMYTFTEDSLEYRNYELNNILSSPMHIPLTNNSLNRVFFPLDSNLISLRAQLILLHSALHSSNFFHFNYF